MPAAISYWCPECGEPEGSHHGDGCALGTGGHHVAAPASPGPAPAGWRPPVCRVCGAVGAWDNHDLWLFTTPGGTLHLRPASYADEHGDALCQKCMREAPHE